MARSGQAHASPVRTPGPRPRRVLPDPVEGDGSPRSSGRTASRACPDLMSLADCDHISVISLEFWSQQPRDG